MLDYHIWDSSNRSLWPTYLVPTYKSVVLCECFPIMSELNSFLFFLECVLLFPFLSFDSRSIDSRLIFLKSKWDYHWYSEWVYDYCWIDNHIEGGYSRNICGDKHSIAYNGKSCRNHSWVEWYSKIPICCCWRPWCTILEYF